MVKVAKSNKRFTKLILVAKLPDVCKDWLVQCQDNVTECDIEAMMPEVQ